ncbi:DMT family transporter [Gemmatimonadota bacterium]
MAHFRIMKSLKREEGAGRRARIWIAYVTVSIVWGSTYLAMRIGVQEVPPFWMAGVRLLAAGVILLGIALYRRNRFPGTLKEWGWLALTGTLILGVAIGGMFWAVQYLDSGLAALLACFSPLLMALYGSIGADGDRLDSSIVFGLLAGLVGIAVLLDPRWSIESASMPLIAVAVIIIGANAWSGGSVLSKRRLKNIPPLVSASVHSLSGGLFLLGIDLLVRHDPLPPISGLAWASILYLVIFGSVIAYSAYIYLVTHLPPAKAGTFTFINPVVAVFLGWLILDEPVTSRLMLGGVIIFAGLMLVRRSRTGQKAPVPMSGPGQVEKPIL